MTTNNAPHKSPTVGLPEPEPRKKRTPPASSVPEEWTSAFALYRYSEKAIRFNLGTNVWIAIISLAIGYTITIPIKNLFVGTVVDLIVSALFLGGQTFAQIAGVRNIKVSLNEALSKGFYYSLQLFFAMILIDIVCVISLLLLVVPFFFVVPRLALTYYFIVDKDMNVIDACRASWDATEGHSLMIWAIFGVILLIFLPFLTLIGIPISIYLYIMYSASFALMYEVLSKPQSKPVESALNK
jgi:hypothetical protein